MQKAVVVILNWNTEGFLRRFLPGLVASMPEGCEVIVADNASTDGSLRLMASQFPQVRVIALDRNYGFTGGYNRAFLALEDLYEYFLLINSDIEVPPSGWLEPLLAYMDAHPDCGACAPKLHAWQERDSFEYAGAAGGFIDRYGYPFCRGRVLKKLERDYGQYDSPRAVFWASGACLLVRSALYRELGGLDERFFAHMEEIDLCWRMQRAGYHVAVVPASTVWHIGGGTLPPTSPTKLYLNYRNNLLMLYHTIFDSSIINTMFYDCDGYLRDINEKGCETFGIRDRRILLERGINIHDVPAYKGIDIEHVYGYHMTSITDIDKERSKNGTHIPDITLSGKIYYDTIVNPIHDEQGRLLGVYTAGRSINEMVESYHRQQESTRQLQETSRHIQEYIDNINMALRVSEVRLMNYLPDTHEVEISNDLNTAKLLLTQLRCFTLVAPEHRHQVATMIRQMDRRMDTRIDLTVQTTLRDEKGRDVWLTFNIIPMKRADGSVSHYFGMCRNETEMVSMAAKLKEESRKAQETELLKNAFLQNMSHEIRTPLSAVIGFAELLTSDHDPAEEAVFINHIKTNSDLLLQLVNDVLFISRLDAHMVEINKHPADFALLFECWCHMGWTDHQPGVNVITENPYNHLMINIDETNLALVIQKLCACAAQNTSEGFIRAKYEYRNGMLIIKVDDTGKGLDAENQKRVFDRFNRNLEGKYCGTGLVLPIIKELTEQMGGTIEFQSEPGKGSTIWVTVPCEATTSERKTT